MKHLKIELKWAIIFSLVLLAWMFMEKSLGWHDQHIAKHPIYTMLFVIPAILLYFFAIKDKRDNYFQGKMNWKQGFMSGLMMSIILVVLTPLNQYMIHEVITPDYFENVIDYTVANDQMTLEKAKNYFNLKSYLIQSLFWALGMGVVTSAIVAFFLKRS